MEEWIGISRIFPDAETLAREFFTKGHYLADSPEQIELERRISIWTGGEVSAVTNCGMAAIGAVFNLLCPGDVLICSKYIYPGTTRLINDLERKYVKIRWVDPNNLAQVREAAKFADNSGSATIIYFLEMIGNSPTMPVADFRATMIALEMLRKENLKVVVDTTFVPTFHPFVSQRYCGYTTEIIEVASLSKWEGNGVVAGGRISGLKETIKGIKDSPYFRGVVMQPKVAEEIRLDRVSKFPIFCKNALAAAKILAASPVIKNVYYPGLESHLGYKLVQTQFDGLAGGVLYAVIGSEQSAAELADYLGTEWLSNALTVKSSWAIAPSFGSDEWRILPCLGELASHYPDYLGLIRIAAGLDVDGLVELRGGLKKLESTLE